MSYSDSNYILAMDAHFSSDLMVFTGYSEDYYFNMNIKCSWCDIPYVTAMSIAEPFFIWAISAAERNDERFADLDISEDG